MRRGTGISPSSNVCAKRARTRSRDEEGRPTENACQYRRLEMVRILVVQGAVGKSCSPGNPSTVEFDRSGWKDLLGLPPAVPPFGDKSLFAPAAGGLPGLPLAGSPWVRGPENRLIRIVLHGVRGPLEVHDKTYDLEMPGFGRILSDADVASLLSYVRRRSGAACLWPSAATLG